MAHLCLTCAHARTIATERSVFWLCARHASEPDRFPKYPPVPVLRCAGHEKGTPRDFGST